MAESELLSLELGALNFELGASKVQPNNRVLVTNGKNNA